MRISWFQVPRAADLQTPDVSKTYNMRFERRRREKTVSKCAVGAIFFALTENEILRVGNTSPMG